jgi:hypothetical protein
VSLGVARSFHKFYILCKLEIYSLFSISFGNVDEIQMTVDIARPYSDHIWDHGERDDMGFTPFGLIRLESLLLYL